MAPKSARAGREGGRLGEDGGGRRGGASPSEAEAAFRRGRARARTHNGDGVRERTDRGSEEQLLRRQSDVRRRRVAVAEYNLTFNI